MGRRQTDSVTITGNTITARGGAAVALFRMLAASARADIDKRKRQAMANNPGALAAAYHPHNQPRAAAEE